MDARPLRITAALVAAGVMACPLSAWAGPVRIGEQQGLGLLGPETPAILKQAKAEPYAVPASCETVAAELAALDEALGPDADEPALKRNQAAKLVTKAIRGLIPHRDVVRFVTGAGRKEGALQQAAMAGWARRGFLKGVSRQMDCAGAADQIQASAPAPAEPAIAAETQAIPVSDRVEESAPAPVDVSPAPLQIQTIDTPQPAAVAVNP